MNSYLVGAVSLALSFSSIYAQETPAGPTGPAEAAEGELLDGFEYRMVGPSRGGRVTAVEGHRSHPGTFYMGASGGGIWKTDDFGQSWTSIGDGYLASPSIGHIEVADSDPTIIFVGTGSDGIRSNVIIGKGLYKSTDSGETWTLMGLVDAGQIGAVKAHPENPDLVYAAALGNPFGRNDQRGVYRSANGGLGWERVLFTSDSVGAVDLELHPTDPVTIYAAMWRAERKPWTIISGAADEDGVWKSSDGGDTWRRITSGLPQGLIGKIDFAVSPADPDRVYALVEAPTPEQGLYRSDDAGETWYQMNADEDRELMHRPFYFTNITADPTDADVVYVNNLRFWKSVDGGKTFESISTPHGDNHDLWVNPDDPRLMIQANDGGANVSRDGGRTWSSIYNQPTAELYQVDVDDRFPYWLYAGQQDNSTIAVPSLPPAEPGTAGAEAWWKDIGGCETGPAVPKPGDPDIVYANCKGRFGRFNMRTGQEQQYYVGAVNLYGHNPADLTFRFQRVVPIEVSPLDPEVVYHGSQFVHRTRDGGRTWETISPDLTAFPAEYQVASGTPINRDITGEEHYSTLYVIEASPHEADVIWSGANDGPVHVTRDGGTTWTDVTPPMPGLGRVNAIEISPHNPAKVYVVAYRYLLADFQPYIFRTDDYGETWTLLTDGTNGIPADFPARVVREDPDREGLLFAGTDFGMFLSFDDGGTWLPFQQNLPVTPITDIEVVRKDLAISTMGRSFWILDDLTPLHQLDGETVGSLTAVGAEGEASPASPILFAPRDAHRVRYSRPGGYGPTNPAAPEYPAAGALVQFYLPPESAGPVSLEVLDAEGEVVRRYDASEPASEEEGGEDRPEGMGSGSGFGRGSGRGLPADPGLQRFRWDLRYEGPWSAPREGSGGDRGGSSDPTAVPGDYRVRLAVGDWSATEPLRLAMDPRVEAEGITVADLEEQLQLALQVRDAVSQVGQAAAEVDSLLAMVDTAMEEQSGAEGLGALREELLEIRAALIDAEGAYPQPMLVSQLQYLYGMLSRADQAPGGDAYARYEELRAELDRRLGQISALRPRLRE
jgi:photosystem II stability/assembly factor-like uncharacterized protein